MIGLIMTFAGQTAEIRINGVQVFFRTSQFQRFADIEGIKLNDSGIIKEFPDLKDKTKEERRIEAIKRFKEKIKNYNTEEERVKYIMEDLIKFGWKPQYIQKAGFRPKRL